VCVCCFALLPTLCRAVLCSLQLNLKQAEAVRFLTSLNDATGYDDSLTTMYRLIQESSIDKYLSDKNTRATLFAPVDDVSRGSACARRSGGLGRIRETGASVLSAVLALLWRRLWRVQACTVTVVPCSSGVG
jgi:hypothetical protein